MEIGRNIIADLKRIGTSTVSDAMDRLGLRCGLYGIHGITDGKVICGPAFTVHYVPCGTEKGTVGDFLDDVNEGEVVVIDNGGRDYCTVWGGIMSVVASLKGIEGTVIDGVCRDVDVIEEQSYPIFTKGRYMVTGKDRVTVDAVGKPVSISGILVRPGDIILGDSSGVIVIPQEKVALVLNVANEIHEKEIQIEEKVRSGIPLKEARAMFSYHTLQTREA